MKSILSAIIIVAASFPCGAQQPATEAPPSSAAAEASEEVSIADIRKRFALIKIKALNDYLAANPKAGDFQRGLLEIVHCYRDEVGDRERALSTLDRIYDYLVANPGELKEGLRELYHYHVGMEDDKGAVLALEREYALLAKGADSDLAALGGNLYSTVYRLTGSELADKVEKAKGVVEKARKELAGHADTKGVDQLFARLDGLINPPVIGTAPEIAFTALDGTKVNVADMKGKVVLLDFWATWCGPCVASMPGIKAAYDKFHDKGFEVIGISLDDANARSKVEDFVKNKKLPWPQSFEGKGFEHSLAVTFGIKAIPATFLLGKDGKIVATELHGEGLEAKLAELLK
jgi:thiol-disulfide isomerase/thioredoxin